MPVTLPWMRHYRTARRSRQAQGAPLVVDAMLYRYPAHTSRMLTHLSQFGKYKAWQDAIEIQKCAGSLLSHVTCMWYQGNPAQCLGHRSRADRCPQNTASCGVRA